jgi:four helix bundle protein
MAFQEAGKLLACIHAACISDAKLRDQAIRAATSVCLNIAEGAGRTAPADKARVHGIARGESCEAATALDIAHLAGACKGAQAEAGARHARAVYALLSGLIRRFSSAISG